MEYLKLLEKFSLITIGEDKIPNYSWKAQTKEKLSETEFTRRVQHTIDSTYRRSDGSEGVLKATKRIGLVTGYADVEVIDIDLKVFSTQQERDDFYSELIDVLRDTIHNFDTKFVVYRTQNNGYHILYRTKRVSGNRKLAVLENHTEAVIETRGIGGYVLLYPENMVGVRSYFDIDYISDEDWRSLINVCSSYNFIKVEKEELPKKTQTEFQSGLTPWEDFNNQNTVWDVVGDEFDIVKTTPKKTFVKRKGGTSPHSGYIFNDSGCLFLFSSGTIYPFYDGTESTRKEALLTPFKLFTHRYHGGDFAKSASDLYEQGFGDRAQVKPSKGKQEQKRSEEAGVKPGFNPGFKQEDKQEFPFNDLFNKARVNLKEDVARPDIVISIGEHEYKGLMYPNAVMTGGEFSVIAAPSKTRKSFFKSALASAYIGGGSNKYFSNIKGHRDKDYSVIDVDTEQSEYYAQRAFRRVPEMVGGDYENYYPFRMRFMSVQDRVKFLDTLLYSGRIKDPKLMFIDGIADLIEDTNDLVLSNEAVGYLMKWTDDFKMHICAVIHTAFETAKPTGHLGSAVTKKAESVFVLSKNGEGQNADTLVEHAYSRGHSFDNFSFNVKDGLPRLSDESNWVGGFDNTPFTPF